MRSPRRHKFRKTALHRDDCGTPATMRRCSQARGFFRSARSTVCSCPCTGWRSRSASKKSPTVSPAAQALAASDGYQESGRGTQNRPRGLQRDPRAQLGICPHHDGRPPRRRRRHQGHRRSRSSSSSPRSRERTQASPSRCQISTRSSPRRNALARWLRLPPHPLAHEDPQDHVLQADRAWGHAEVSRQGHPRVAHLRAVHARPGACTTTPSSAGSRSRTPKSSSIRKWCGGFRERTWKIFEKPLA